MADTVVALVADHAGFELKNSLNDPLDEHGFPGPWAGDCRSRRRSGRGRQAGCRTRGGPRRARPTACGGGAGIGIAIAAHRYPWLRAAMWYDVTPARLARGHDAGNALALGARLIGLEAVRDCLLIFSQHCAGGRRVTDMSAVP